jgi:hypothetical protein
MYYLLVYNNLTLQMSQDSIVHSIINKCLWDMEQYFISQYAIGRWLVAIIGFEITYLAQNFFWRKGVLKEMVERAPCRRR